MATILSGEIRWAWLEPVAQVVGHEQGNSRPVLVLSNDRSIERTQLAIAALITTNSTIGMAAVLIQSVSMRHRSWVLANQIRTLSVDRLGTLVGRMSEDEMQDVVAALYLTIIP